MEEGVYSDDPTVQADIQHMGEVWKSLQTQISPYNWIVAIPINWFNNWTRFHQEIIRAFMK